jgi:negative regulator of sigma E activity
MKSRFYSNLFHAVFGLALLLAPLAAGAGPAVPQDKATAALVRKMLIAQKRLPLEGTMVTQTSLGTFVQYAILDGAHAQRYLCLSPAKNKGEVIIDNGHVRYHIYPDNKVVVLPSEMRERKVRVPQVMREIWHGNLFVKETGTGVIAGHSCVIVKIDPPYGADWYQYWIDPANGAQLRIEQYSSSGQELSATYFTNVVYNPKIDMHLFAPPQTQEAHPALPNDPPSSPTLPTVAQAGFVVLQPAYLPTGFHFQSSGLSLHNNKNLVKITYGNGLNALSLFETPMTGHGGPNAAKIKNPRPGVVITRRYGLVIVLVGSIDESQLEQVLNSVH